ncbi:hypothetical protein [Streptomyces indiaensis]|uniref:Uncharacterized protein n=1 Tax=Streptomyces indiaensis TaxID=284033 RepID=A0ABN3EDU8_9ACTN|nr:hypothetical protein [Streptomyces indiaensis]MCF1648896.1 hypothetical protein [Streptomyces indiaensis]
MHPNHHPPREGRKQRTTARRWAARHRRTARAHILRGACYGLGTGATGLAFMWLERLM